MKTLKKLIGAEASPIKEIIADSLEVVLDDHLSDGPLKEIPIIGSLLKLYKAGIGIRDRLFYNKLVAFLENIDILSTEERDAFWSAFESDEQARHKLGEQLILYIDRYDDREKPALLARAFNAFQKGLIAYTDLLDLGILITSVKTHNLDKIAEIIYRLSDLDYKDLYEKKEEMPFIYLMEKDGLLMIESVLKMRHVNGESERQPKIEKTYMATKLAINFSEYVIYDYYQRVADRIGEFNKASMYIVVEGFKGKHLEAERQETYARQAKASSTK